MRSETAAALRAVATARDLADRREGADRVTSKGGNDLVTDADLGCEDAIRAALGAAMPRVPVVGEERGGEAPNDGSYWLVDPICGTRLYASEVPLYCTNVALVEAGAVTVAAIAAGRTGELVWAERGRGAWSREPSADRDRRLAVSAASAAIWIDGSSAHAANVVHAAMLQRRWYVWKWSSSIAYLQLALGRIAGIVHFFSGIAPLHTAAGALVAAEAGAVITDLDGAPWDIASVGHVIAATADLHRELRDIVEAAR
jgi:myo-inositol-1(or 4)-monophosphatase